MMITPIIAFMIRWVVSLLLKRMTPRCIYSATNILRQNFEQFFNIRIDSDHLLIDIAIKSFI